MIEVRKVGPEFKERWNEYIEQSQYAIAWQAYDWAEVLSEHYKYDFLPHAAFEGSKLIGVLPLYYGSANGKRPALLSVPFAVAGGIVADNEEARVALLEVAISISKERGNLPLTLKQYKIRIPGDLKTDENYFNKELALTSDLDSLCKEIDPKNLRLAEKALSMGLQVEHPSNDIDSFYNILLRHHASQGVPCNNIDWIRSLIEFKMYSIAVAKIDGRVVAATMTKAFKKTVSFPFSCVLPNSDEGDIGIYGLYWELISQFASEGFEIFHSGRIPKTQEAIDFRLGWGGRPHPYFYQYYPNTGGSTESTKKRGWKRNLVSAVWKRMPLTVAKRIGPIVVKRFP